MGSFSLSQRCGAAHSLKPRSLSRGNQGSTSASLLRRVARAFLRLAPASVLVLSGALRAEPLTIVEVANFDCPACKKAEACHKTIASMVERENGRFVFAPIPTSGGDGGRESLYYASRYEERLEREVRHLLFASQGMPELPSTASLEGAISWMSMQNDYPYWDQLSLLARSKGTEALERAIRLAAQAGVTAFPSYLVVKAGIPTLVHSGAPESCASLIRTLRETNK